jgi:hypothetical protein
LDNAQLQRLLEAVIVEINRRKQRLSERDTGTAGATKAPQLVAARSKQGTVDEIPEGKANLIRASFSAGLKPAAIRPRVGNIPVPGQSHH